MSMGQNFGIWVWFFLNINFHHHSLDVSTEIFEMFGIKFIFFGNISTIKMYGMYLQVKTIIFLLFATNSLTNSRKKYIEKKKFTMEEV